MTTPTIEQLQAKNLAQDVREAKPMTTEEALESCQRFIDGWFKNHDSNGHPKPYPRITIPTDLNRDDDVRLMAHIQRTASHLARVDAERDSLKIINKTMLDEHQDMLNSVVIACTYLPNVGGYIKQIETENKEVQEVIRDFGRVLGCNHTEDGDGRRKLVRCLREVIETELNSVKRDRDATRAELAASKQSVAELEAHIVGLVAYREAMRETFDARRSVVIRALAWRAMVKEFPYRGQLGSPAEVERDLIAAVDALAPASKPEGEY